MSDLVERLRSPIIGIPVAVSNCLEAANEIERLMTLLEAEIKTTTHLAAENEKLRAALREALAALSYYADATYTDSSDIQDGCAIETIDTIEQALGGDDE